MAGIYLTLDKKLQIRLKNAAKVQGYLSVQELVRDILRERLEKSPIEKVALQASRELKKLGRI